VSLTMLAWAEAQNAVASAAAHIERVLFMWAPWKFKQTLKQ